MLQKVHKKARGGDVFRKAVNYSLQKWGWPKGKYYADQSWLSANRAKDNEVSYPDIREGFANQYRIAQLK